MVIVGDVLVSEEVLTARFCCDLKVCKGACCVAGDAGAPLTRAEAERIDSAMDTLSSYMEPQGREAVAQHGAAVVGEDGLETPCVDNRECAYVRFDDDGTVKCGIEQAHNDVAINFEKPISCALYPLRIEHRNPMPVLHYHQWGICSGGRALGETTGLPLIQFLEAPLRRRFGDAFYNQLSAITQAYGNQAE